MATRLPFPTLVASPLTLRWPWQLLLDACICTTITTNANAAAAADDAAGAGAAVPDDVLIVTVANAVHAGFIEVRSVTLRDDMW